ncbi:MAG: DsrE family protein [Pseudomonadota bacterium]
MYHLSEDGSQAYRALNNIANQLRADPEVKIVVVAYGKGLEFLKRGMISSDSNSAFVDAVVPLQKRGVQFRVCRNSMNAMRLDAGDMIDEVAIVPSGIAEIVSLQARDGYAYVHP